MQVNLELTKKLTLNYIEENMVRDEKLISVYLSFSFYGEDGDAYLILEKLEEEYPNYAMTSIASDISDSFNEQLEDDEIYAKIKAEVKKFVTEYELEN
jgi:hypothetical protein